MFLGENVSATIPLTTCLQAFASCLPEVVGKILQAHKWGINCGSWHSWSVTVSVKEEFKHPTWSYQNKQDKNERTISILLANINSLLDCFVHRCSYIIHQHTTLNSGVSVTVNHPIKIFGLCHLTANPSWNGILFDIAFICLDLQLLSPGHWYLNWPATPRRHSCASTSTPV